MEKSATQTFKSRHSLGANPELFGQLEGRCLSNHATPCCKHVFCTFFMFLRVENPRALHWNDCGGGKNVTIESHFIQWYHCLSNRLEVAERQ